MNILTDKTSYLLCICLVPLFLTCRNSTRQTQTITYSYPEEKADTTVVQCIEYPGFQFYIKQTQDGLLDEYRYFSTIHFNASDKSRFLFDVNHHYLEEVPENIFNDYYLWTHWTGGNGSYTLYEIVFKMNADTAFILGQVCDYDDITGDGKPELYNWYLVEYGEARAMDKYENEIVTIRGDSLSQNFPFN